MTWWGSRVRAPSRPLDAFVYWPHFYVCGIRFRNHFADELSTLHAFSDCAFWERSVACVTQLGLLVSGENKPVRFGLMKKFVPFVFGATFVLSFLATPIHFVSAARPAAIPTITWKMSSMKPTTAYSTSAIASSNSTGIKAWSVSGSCTLKSGRITTKSSGSCTVKLNVKTKGKFTSRTASKKFAIASSAASNETVSQSNARRSGESYLKFSSFSRTGLIKQLEFEGFSNPDAVYGTDAQKADWNSQATKSAAGYLKSSSFSRSGLVKQLVFEGFTDAEAEFGVAGGSTDWNSQAAKTAASYLKSSTFSRKGLLDQLLFEGFTQAEAEYGVGTTGL